MALILKVFPDIWLPSENTLCLKERERDSNNHGHYLHKNETKNPEFSEEGSNN